MGRRVLSYSMHIGIKKFDGFESKHDYLEFYKRIFGENLKQKKYPYYQTFCPFHKDNKTPNFYINIISGRYHCFACSAKGSYSDFILYSAIKGKFINIPEIKDRSELKKIKNYEKKKSASEIDLLIEKNKADAGYNLLLRNTQAMQKLWKEKGINKKSIDKYKIGFMEGTYTIPIYDRIGKMACLKFHKRSSTKGSSNQIYPWKAVLHNSDPYVVLVEGEFDTILLRQMGINACTQIFGVGGWEDYFTKYFKNKTVYILYDKDRAGEKGTAEIYKKMLYNYSDIRFPVWPEHMLEKEDHIDYFIKYNKSVSDYWAMLKKAPSKFTPKIVSYEEIL